MGRPRRPVPSGLVRRAGEIGTYAAAAEAGWDPRTLGRSLRRVRLERQAADVVPDPVGLLVRYNGSLVVTTADGTYWGVVDGLDDLRRDGGAPTRFVPFDAAAAHGRVEDGPAVLWRDEAVDLLARIVPRAMTGLAYRTDGASTVERLGLWHYRTVTRRWENPPDEAFGDAGFASTMRVWGPALREAFVRPAPSRPLELARLAADASVGDEALDLVATAASGGSPPSAGRRPALSPSRYEERTPHVGCR